MSDEINIKTKSKKIKLLIIIAAVVITLLTVGAVIYAMSKNATAKKVEKQLSLGEKYLSDLEYKQAIAAYELAIEIDPKNADAYIGLAEVYEAMGEYEKAEEILEEARDVIKKEEDVDRIKRKEKKVEKKKEEAKTQSKNPEPPLTSKPTVTPSTSLSEEVKGISKVAVGEYITFGSYEQDNNLANGAEEIEWLVLDVQDGKALLLSKYGLDAQPYNEEYENVTWETCTLRRWLNNSFYDNAFKSDEKESIIQSVIINDDNPTYKTEGGNDTRDYVFLLSIKESKEYFSEDTIDSYGRNENPERATTPTKYAISKGGYVAEHGEWDDGNCYWWLRSPGGQEFLAASVNSDGRVYDGHIQDEGNHVYSNLYTVRPALWISIESNDSVPDVAEQELSGIKEEDARIGKYVTFGRYEQDNVISNGQEAIEWLVLDIQDGKALLLSRYGLDCQTYHKTWTYVTWENCTLRSWLNSTFYEKAFSEAEKNGIVKTLLGNEDTLELNLDGGNDTEDNVFLLSIEEAQKYFSEKSEGSYICKERVTIPTAYAMAKGVWTSSSGEWKGNCAWSLRSPFDEMFGAAGVYLDGGINIYYGGYDAVRPALWVDIVS